MIVILEGASGAGKTTVAKGLLSDLPKARMVRSYVTGRGKRASDLPGEYRHVSRFVFWLIESLGLFLWTVDVHGNKYGTLRWSVNRGLKNKQDVFIIILFKKTSALLNYSYERGSSEFIYAFYIISPGREVLKERLKKRGDNDIEISKRLKDCEKWDSDAAVSGIPFIFVRNDLEPRDTVEKIKAHINGEVEEEWF